MTSDLKDFFSAIGKAKKEKEDEVRSLVGNIDIDSMFSQVKNSLETEFHSLFKVFLSPVVNKDKD